MVTIGSTVAVLRNLDHPAWRGRDRTPDEFIGEMTVTETTADRVRLSNGLWYTLTTGDQHNSGATRFEEM